MVEYYRPNFFANTPDILHEYLQRGGRPAFRVRLLLAATLSPIYGMYSGFELCENVPLHAGSEEYLHSEKYEIRTRSFGVPESIERDVALLNRIRRENPALQRLDNLEFLATGHEEMLAYRKSSPSQDLIIVVNLNPVATHETMISTPLDALGIVEGEPFEVEDLLTAERYVWRGRYNYVKLDPAHRVGHVLRVIRQR
jgi:starch synthase (maltosyl-transferring)